ncbi:MAG: pyridoxamine 5'-phosphate oxidase, partial [Actinomycetota bacterium]|nr:pyridoxamine 5'-phosphate oxidase [Actinomycetota bacterium]
SYGELRGVSITGMGEVSAESDTVLAVGEAVLTQAGGGGLVDDASRESFKRSAAKRVAVIVRPSRVVTWDHSKLAGGY